MDIIVHLIKQPASFISKAGVKKVPFVGNCATACGSLYIERSSKESKKSLLEKIGERQIECE